MPKGSLALGKSLAFVNSNFLIGKMRIKIPAEVFFFFFFLNIYIIYVCVYTHRVLNIFFLCCYTCATHGLYSIVHGILQARILEWVAFPFSRGSSQPWDGTQISCIAGGFFTSWATREAHIYIYVCVWRRKQTELDSIWGQAVNIRLHTWSPSQWTQNFVLSVYRNGIPMENQTPAPDKRASGPVLGLSIA